MIVAVVQARMGSSRLPGKVLADIGGEPMLARQLRRIERARRIDRLCVATSDGADDDAVADVAERAGVSVFRGAVDDVLDRVWRAARAARATHVVRLTADCPLTDPGVIDEVIGQHVARGNDLTSNVVERTFPDGLDVEVMTAEALDRVHAQARSGPDREHVTRYIYRRGNGFRVGSVVGAADLAAQRWTVDYPEDLDFVRAVFAAFAGQESDFSFGDVMDLLESEPALISINAVHNPALSANRA
jgi:spore coat polysaccharide biosynthesis protein SpsF